MRQLDLLLYSKDVLVPALRLIYSFISPCAKGKCIIRMHRTNNYLLMTQGKSVEMAEKQGFFLSGCNKNVT
jgi:hypothetical protein